MSSQSQSGAAERRTPFAAWRRRQRLSVHQASRYLRIPYTVVRGVNLGKVPNLRTAAKVVYGSRRALRFEDLLPPEELAELQRLYPSAPAADE